MGGGAGGQAGGILGGSVGQMGVLGVIVGGLRARLGG